MGIRENFQKLIDKKLQEIRDLQLQMEKAEAYVQALQDSMKLLPRESANGVSPEQTLRPGTAMAKARDILRAQGKPMHISELLKALGRPVDKKNKVSIGGSISTYVRNQQIFTRPAPNTFGLMEFSGPAEGVTLEDALPESFGKMQ